MDIVRLRVNKFPRAAEANEAEPFSLLYRLVLLLWKVAILALPAVVWVGHGRSEEARRMSN